MGTGGAGESIASETNCDRNAKTTIRHKATTTGTATRDEASFDNMFFLLSERKDFIVL